MKNGKSVLYPFWAAAIALSILASVFCLCFASCSHSGGEAQTPPSSQSTEAPEDEG